ncbi:hypothetical protein [Streptomyces sp. NPDC086147]|uniref:hypothetical protein n=1 Tax=Streptomyces sp. NPDC086147 TaxID=3155295 RepID=UPI00344F7190
MLDRPGGRVIVGAFGIVLIIVGVVILMRSLIRKFEENLRADEMSPAGRRDTGHRRRRGVRRGCGRPVRPAGRRAVRPRPGQGPGRYPALVRRGPAGPALLIAAAAGLLLFGLCSFCEARRRKAAEYGTPAVHTTGAE